MSDSRLLAVVTGAGSGIGLALTQALLDRDFNVVAIDIDLSATDQRAQLHQVDVRDVDAMADIAKHYQNQPLHYLFANAGVAVHGDALNRDNLCFDNKVWEWAWQVNVVGVLRTIQLWWQHLLAGQGKLIATASAAALQSFPGAGPYRATKAALVSALEGLYYQSTDSGVGIHVLFPGMVSTNISHLRRYEDAAALSSNPDNKFVAAVKETMKNAETATSFANRVLTNSTTIRRFIGLLTPNHARG